MAAIELNVENVLAALESAVEMRGESYVYEKQINTYGEGNSCVYVKDGKPSCLAAQALNILGVEVDMLKLGDKEYGVPADKLVRLLKSYGVIEGENIETVGQILWEAQASQDHGDTWGLALAKATQIAESWRQI